MEKERSQYLHLYGCSPVWVRKCRVKLADRGNTFPQNLHEYLFFLQGVDDGTFPALLEETLRGLASWNGLEIIGLVEEDLLICG